MGTPSGKDEGGQALGVVASQAPGLPSPPRVLVVDDDERVRGLLHRALEDGMPGCVVEEAEDGLAAQAKIPAFRPHLLVLDLCMPRLDGAELCRWVKTSGSPETKVVILTANTDAGLLGRALEAGAEAWMPKPSSLPALLAKIRGLLAP